MSNKLGFEYIIRDARNKEGTVKIKSQNISPEVEITIDNQKYKFKIIHNELVAV